MNHASQEQKPRRYRELGENVVVVAMLFYNIRAADNAVYVRAENRENRHHQHIIIKPAYRAEIAHAARDNANNALDGENREIQKQKDELPSPEPGAFSLAWGLIRLFNIILVGQGLFTSFFFFIFPAAGGETRVCIISARSH